MEELCLWLRWINADYVEDPIQAEERREVAHTSPTGHEKPVRRCTGLYIATGNQVATKGNQPRGGFSILILESK